jgi:acetyl-CoA synthetase
LHKLVIIFPDGYFWILGRMDDVLNVSGHRLGTGEIESALVRHSDVAEAAVVGKPHNIKGEAICAFVICKNTRNNKKSAAELIKELEALVIREIGPIAKPDDIILVEALPKTRSGKIMRRLLRSLARSETITGDLSTLENPAVIEDIKAKLKYLG